MNVTLYEKNNFTFVYAENPPALWPLLSAILTPPIPQDPENPIEVPSFFNPEYACFLRGFTDMVAFQLHQQGHVVHWQRHDQPLRNVNTAPPAGQLLHLQPWVVEEMAKHEYGIIDIATRFGKSYVYAGWYVRMGRPMTLLVVPRAAIAEQMQQELSAWLGEPVGMVAGSVNPTPEWQNFTVAIEQSLCTDRAVRSEHLPYLQAVEARIRDENHILGILMDVVNSAMPYCRYAWGGSATPFTEDVFQQWRITGWYGPSRVRVSSKVLADRGVLSPVEASFHRFIHDHYTQNLEWQELYKSEVVNNTQRNQMIADLANYEISQGRVGLVFINYVKHAKNLLPLIPNSKIVASKLLTHRESEKIKRDFNAGEVSCVIVTKKWREGVTLRADFGVNAEGGKADHVVLQKLGRGLLPKENGAALRWHDILDSGNGLLNRHAMARRSCVLREEWPVRTYNQLQDFQRAEKDSVFRTLVEIDNG